MENSKENIDLHTELASVKYKLTVCQQQLDDVQLKYEEVNDILTAIRSGEVDALVINSDNGVQLYGLKDSDYRYRLIIEQMMEGAVTINKEGIILYCNTRFGDMVSRPLETLMGNNFQNFVCKADLDYFDELLMIAWTSPVKAELDIIGGEETSIPVLLSLNRLTFDGETSMSLILTDLSQQKANQSLLQNKNIQLQEAQEATRLLNENLESNVRERTKDLEQSILEKTTIEIKLRRNEERLSRILETMAEGVKICDWDGKVVYANPMAQKMLGITVAGTNENFIDPKWPCHHIDGSLLLEHEHPTYIALHNGQPVYDYEFCIHPPQGSPFYLLMNAAPLRDANNEVIASVCTFMDVTHRRKVIQQKDEFISVASHELKTPVTSLQASLQLLDILKNDPDPGKKAMVPNLITNANKSLIKLSHLINDLLDVSKLLEGQLRLNKQSVSLYNIAQECCGGMPASNIVIDILGDRELRVDADADKLDQVIVNYLNNAFKYASSSKRIIINIEKAGNDAKLSVTDQGTGIPADKIPHLFDRFFRVDATGAQYSGLGLGLYICSEIIKKHGGTVGVTSEINVGSTFWFKLPL